MVCRRAHWRVLLWRLGWNSSVHIVSVSFSSHQPPFLTTPSHRQDILHGGRSRGKDYSKHRCLVFPWVVKNCLIYLKSPLKTYCKQSFRSEECEVTVCGAKLVCRVFNIPVDCFRLDKINILDTPSLFPVTVPANNRSCQEAASPRCQLNQEAVY